MGKYATHAYLKNSQKGNKNYACTRKISSDLASLPCCSYKYFPYDFQGIQYSLLNQIYKFTCSIRAFLINWTHNKNQQQKLPSFFLTKKDMGKGKNTKQTFSSMISKVRIVLP